MSGHKVGGTPELKARVKELEARIAELEGLMQEFCDRVDRGEARSVKTYAKFKAALKENASCPNTK